jgi:tRNA ligase
MSNEARATGSSTKRSRFSPESVDALLDSLNRLKLNQPKAVSQTIHVYEPLSSDDRQEDGSHKRYITSWKMQEHLYRRKDCPFPTLARGIFTAAEDFSLQQPLQRGEAEEGGRKRIRIVARGYDKFFNIGEVPWTEVGEHPLCSALGRG